MEAHHDGSRPLILDELSSRLEQLRLLGESDVAIPLAVFVLFPAFCARWHAG